MIEKVKKAQVNKKAIKPKPQKPKIEKVKEDLDNYNKQTVTQQVIINRTLKYRYPRDCKDTLARKSFRQKVRNKLHALERGIFNSRGEDRKKAKEALESYQSKVLI